MLFLCVIVTVLVSPAPDSELLWSHPWIFQGHRPEVPAEWLERNSNPADIRSRILPEYLTGAESPHPLR